MTPTADSPPDREKVVQSQPSLPPSPRCNTPPPLVSPTRVHPHSPSDSDQPSSEEFGPRLQETRGIVQNSSVATTPRPSCGNSAPRSCDVAPDEEVLTSKNGGGAVSSTASPLGQRCSQATRQSSVLQRMYSVVSRKTVDRWALPGASRKPGLAFRSYTVGPAEAALQQNSALDDADLKEREMIPRHFSDPEITAQSNVKQKKKARGAVAKWRGNISKAIGGPSKSPTLGFREKFQTASKATTRTYTTECVGGQVVWSMYKANAGSKVTPFATDDRRQFWVFHIEFPGVERCFREEAQDWCRSSANARKIFHPQTKEPHLRVGVRAVHNAITQGRGCCGRRHGILRSGSDFQKLIKKDASNYIYSLVDAGLYFTDAKAMLPAELLSKHAILADGEESIRCAGEFHVESRCKDGKKSEELVMNNRSGTYAPGKHAMELMRKLLTDSLPGCDIRIVNVDESDDECTTSQGSTVGDLDPALPNGAPTQDADAPSTRYIRLADGGLSSTIQDDELT